MTKIFSSLRALIQFRNKILLFKMIMIDVITGKLFKSKIYYKTLILNKIASTNNYHEIGTTNVISNELEYLKNFFIDMSGKLYLNSLEFGGAFSYLKNESKTKPILVFNTISDHAGQHNVTFFFDEMRYSFDTDGLTQLVYEFKVSSLMVNHLIWTRNFAIIDEVIKLSNRGIVVSVIIHDFFYLCPSFNLLNSSGEFCNLPELSTCNRCIKKLGMRNSPPWLGIYHDTINLYQSDGTLSLESWRSQFNPLFNVASSIELPSNSARDLFLRVFPLFAGKSIVVPHDLQYLSKINPISQCKKTNSMCVAIMGDIKYHKGMKILERIVQVSNQNNLNISFLVIGSCDSKIIMNASNTIVLNKYDISDLNSILLRYQVNLFLFLSIWPETFSFVIHEMMQTKLPIIAFNLGAPGEFLANYSNSILVNEVSFVAVYDRLLLEYKNYKYRGDIAVIDTPVISVSMATYNGEKYLQEQLDSILTQTIPAYEIVIVDDCSTDNTWQILHEYAVNYPQIKIYQNNDNCGVAKTFDCALSMVSGDYIALADQDDVWVPQKLEVLVANIGENLLIHSDAYVVDGTLQIINSSFLGTKVFTKKNSNYFVFNDVHGCTALIKRELLELALPIPEGFYLHDHYLAIFAAALKKITYIDQPLIYYRQHDSNVVGISKIDDYQEYKNHFRVLHHSLSLLFQPCVKNSAELSYGIDFYRSNLLNKPASFKTYCWYFRNFSLSRSIFFIGSTCFGVKVGRLIFRLRNTIQ